MEWYEKFKVGQWVRVVKKVPQWGYGGTTSWNSEGDMDRTIGKVYRIMGIHGAHGYELQTEYDTYYKCNYYYPVESLQGLVGEQLQFDFMRQGD